MITLVHDIRDIPNYCLLPILTKNKCDSCEHFRKDDQFGRLCVHPENVHYAYPDYGNISKIKMMSWTPQEKNSNGLCEFFEPKEKIYLTIKTNIKFL